MVMNFKQEVVQRRIKESENWLELNHVELESGVGI